MVGQCLNWQLWLPFGTNQPVGEIIAERFPATLQLFVPALTPGACIRSPAGCHLCAASWHGHGLCRDDPVLLRYCMPVFLLGLFAQEIFGVWLHWFPTSGTSTYGSTQDPVSALSIIFSI